MRYKNNENTYIYQQVKNSVYKKFIDYIQILYKKILNMN